jgi:hypothetical protein
MLRAEVIVEGKTFDELQNLVNDFIETLDDYMCVDVHLSPQHRAALIFYKGKRPKTDKKPVKKEKKCQPTAKKSS